MRTTIYRLICIDITHADTYTHALTLHTNAENIPNFKINEISTSRRARALEGLPAKLARMHGRSTNTHASTEYGYDWVCV